jgi:hypothetical protein
MFFAIHALENAAPEREEALRNKACEVARATLHVVGLPRVRDVLGVYAEHFLPWVPQGYEMATALALETLAVHCHARRDYSKDTAVQYLDRAAAIAPHDHRIVERFSEHALAIKPEQLRNLWHDPERQRKVVAGMHNRAKGAIGRYFFGVYKVPHAMLTDAPAGKLVTHLAGMGLTDPRRVFNLISNYSELSMELGLFFKSKPSSIAAFGASIQLFELLGYTQPVSKQLRALHQQVIASPRNEAFEADIPRVTEALRRFAESAERLSRMPKGERLKGFPRHARELLRLLGEARKGA